MVETLPQEESGFIRAKDIYERKRGSVNSLQEALAWFEDNLDVRRVEKVILEKRRIGMIYVHNGSNEKYMVLFKREPYLYFGKHFPNAPHGGEAIITNIKLVHYAAMNDIKIVTVFPDAKAYWADPMKFWKFYEEHKTEHPYIKDEIALPWAMWVQLF
jgi:hypothetical protein